MKHYWKFQYLDEIFFNKMFTVKLYTKRTETIDSQTPRAIMEFTMIKVTPNWSRTKINKIEAQIIYGTKPLDWNNNQVTNTENSEFPKIHTCTSKKILIVVGILKIRSIVIFDTKRKWCCNSKKYTSQFYVSSEFSKYFHDIIWN